jgi:hypothetical protein
MRGLDLSSLKLLSDATQGLKLGAGTAGDLIIRDFVLDEIIVLTGLNTMTPSQEAHLAHLKNTHSRTLDAKYRKGAEEHGGDIRDLCASQLLDEARAENTDQFTYLEVMKAKMTEVKDIMMADGMMNSAIYSILFGVPEVRPGITDIAG